MKELFAKKLQQIQSQLHLGQKLLIVSKTRSIEEIKIYYDLGHRDFGENRVAELNEKANALNKSCPDIRWHMIGHLQSNKINQLFSTPNLWAIHSVDDRPLLEKLINAQKKLTSLNLIVHLFLQFNTSREEEKSGFEDYDSVKSAALLSLDQPYLKLQGLMTMGTLRTDDFKVEAQRCFRELHMIKQRLEKELSLSLETSMGMSQDYEIALAENSFWIRLGTMMFEKGI